MKKHALLCTFSLALLLPLAGCGGGGGQGGGSPEKTIRVQIENGGYGTTWMDELKARFESAYAEEGYKITVLDPHESQAAETDYNSLVAGADTDVYFSSDLLVDRVAKSADFGCLVADLSDEVYGKPAIGFSGAEENGLTVAEKLARSKGYLDVQYKADGKSYCFFYQKSVGGFVYNAAKLSSLGYEAPRTTDELLSIFRGTHKKFVSGETLYQPLTLIGSSPTNGYPNCFLDALLTQYAGIDYWNSVWSLENADGTPMSKEQAIALYSDDALVEAMSVIYALYDANNTCAGTSTFTMNQAHQYVADSNESRRKGGSIFMADGDWMYNETVKKAGVAEEKANNLRFVNFPVISALGTKLWGPSTAHGRTKEQAEAILSASIALFDEGKTVAQVVSAINAGSYGTTITEEEALAVAKARGVYVARGGETGTAYIAAKSTKKDIAYKLLRMFASDDFSTVYHQQTNGYSPYSVGVSSDDPAYFTGYGKAIANPYAEGIWSITTGYRRQCGTMPDLFPYNGSRVCHNVYSSNVTAYDESGNILDASVYATAAKSLCDAEVENLSKNWEKWAR